MSNQVYFEAKREQKEQGFEEYMNELIERDTPKKPNLKSTGSYFCNKCNWRVGNKADLWNPYTYCRNCGQKIDWIEEWK